MHISAEHGYVANIRLLLEFGARIDLRDGLGFSALDLASNGGHTECISVLRDAQVTQEASRVETFTTLLEACLEGSTEQVIDLLHDLRENLELVLNMTVEGSNTILFK